MAPVPVRVPPQTKEYLAVAGVLILMTAISALGATTALILARDIRDLPEGRGRPNVASRPEPGQC